MEQLRSTVLFLATLATGLIAGLFFAYACSVMPALRGADSRTFIDTMQRINVAILNGWFLAAFVGALITTAAAVLLHLGRSGRHLLPWLIAAAVLYMVMLVITSAVNVPLNDRLAAAGAPDRIAYLDLVRASFETSWVRWNLVRAVTASAAFTLLIYALLIRRPAA